MEGESLDPRLRPAYTTQHHQQSYQTPLAPNPARSTAAAGPQYASPAHPTLYPNTPQSADGSTSDAQGAKGRRGSNGSDSKDPKRARACEACRSLKVKCEPDATNPDPEGPCKRCVKSKRECVVTVPSRKRQKKTDSRVAELEKKINALTATLQSQGAVAVALTAGSPPATGHESEYRPERVELYAQPRPNPYQQVTNGGYGSPYPTRPEVRPEERTSYTKAPESEHRKSAPPMVVAGQKRKHIETREYAPASGPQITPANAQKQPEIFGIFHTHESTREPPSHEYADIVDRNITTSEEATTMFNFYVEKMAPHMPSVVFPPGTTAAEVRKTKPIIFLAILSAASGSLNPGLQKILTKEVMSLYADRIICNGEKSLELIQALIVSSLWYWPPEHFEELKFYQLIHIAGIMAIDIGMNKKSSPQQTKVAGLWRDKPWRKTPYPQPNSIESRRTWLSCYFLCCNASMGLRRPNLIRWSTFMTECIEVLETSTEALPSDKSLCQWIRCQHIAEDVGTQFSMDDPGAKVSITDTKVQHTLKSFEIELEKWSDALPAEADSPVLRIMGHVVDLYMHEIAMHVNHNVDEFKPPFSDALLRSEVGQGGLSATHVGALSVCLNSIDGIFETFLKFDVETIRCLPVVNFVRIAYATVVLIKMYFAAATPGSEFGKVINKDSMKVEQYLDGLVKLFKDSAAEEKSRPSAKFLMVLLMLKTWFHRQREEKPQSDENKSSAPATDAPANMSNDPKQNSNMQQRPQSSYSPATSLQLLSEVATNSGGQSRSGSIGNYPGTNDWQQHQPVPFQNYPPMTQMQLPSNYGNVNGGNFDQSLVTDFNYAMMSNDGLEHAMGMTFGIGDLSNFYDDNTFYTGIMENGGFEGL